MALVHAPKASAAQLRRDRARTQREWDRDAKRKAKALLRELREKIKTIRASRKGRAGHVRTMCRQARIDLRETVKRRREELREEARATRLAQRSYCEARRRRVPLDVAAEIDAVRDEIRDVQTSGRDAATLGRAARDTRTAAERRSEAEDEVRTEIPAELLPVWEAKRGKIRQGHRSSLTEAFLQWVHDNSGEVAEILYADEREHLRAIERDEKALAREYRRLRRGGKASAALRERLESSSEPADGIPAAVMSDADDDFRGF